MGQNTLLPVGLDKTITRLEVSPGGAERLHTEVHVVWSALMNGKIFDDWTLQACRDCHFEIVKGMELCGVPHKKLKNNELDEAS